MGFLSGTVSVAHRLTPGRNSQALRTVGLKIDVDKKLRLRDLSRNMEIRKILIGTNDIYKLL